MESKKCNQSKWEESQHPSRCATKKSVKQWCKKSQSKCCKQRPAHRGSLRAVAQFDKRRAIQREYPPRCGRRLDRNSNPYPLRSRLFLYQFKASFSLSSAENPGSPGFLLVQNITIRSYIIIRLVDPPGRVINTMPFTKSKENLPYMPPTSCKCFLKNTR